MSAPPIPPRGARGLLSAIVKPAPSPPRLAIAIQAGVAMLLTVGVPTLFLTTWARPTAPDPHLLTELWRFVVPAMVLTAAAGAALYAYHYTTLLDGFAQSRVPDVVVADFERYTGVSSDDTVSHEWGHAYTEYTSGLIYQWQSGAMNEAYSDIWGETADILNDPQTPELKQFVQSDL